MFCSWFLSAIPQTMSSSSPLVKREMTGGPSKLYANKKIVWIPSNYPPGWCLVSAFFFFLFSDRSVEGAYGGVLDAVAELDIGERKHKHFNLCLLLLRVSDFSSSGKIFIEVLKFFCSNFQFEFDSSTENWWWRPWIKQPVFLLLTCWIPEGQIRQLTESSLRKVDPSLFYFVPQDS